MGDATCDACASCARLCGRIGRAVRWAFCGVERGGAKLVAASNLSSAARDYLKASAELVSPGDTQMQEMQGLNEAAALSAARAAAADPSSSDDGAGHPRAADLAGTRCCLFGPTSESSRSSSAPAAPAGEGRRDAWAES